MTNWRWGLIQDEGKFAVDDDASCPPSVLPDWVSDPD
jgi:hypothetical protein